MMEVASLQKQIEQMGFDAAMAQNLAEIVQITRAAAINECIAAAHDGFESSMKDYVLIGPSGMAGRMINAIKALRVGAIEPQ
jgi:hypothetical protein